MAKVVVGFEGPIPPPFPNGKGAGRLMVVTVFQGRVLVEHGFGFSPLGETGEGFDKCDLTPIPSPKGEGKNAAMPIKNIVTEQRVTKAKLERAKELRREMTPAEKLLWQEIRANKLGVRFRRQQVIQGFIVDFYCHRAGLVVEVDGDIHDLQQDEDARREKALSEMGLRIVRFRNDEVVRELSTVVGRIKETISTQQVAK